MALVKIKNGVVEGVNVNARAQGLKHFFFSKKYSANIKIPILQDINFTCQPGEKVAFIGRNGSGKSSLLKLISGIYPLKCGDIRVEGSIAPIIEMGLGFEPDMTGRQNIKIALVYNKMIDKYSSALEEQVIQFSELGSKIDLPLKIYSSGMISRLAFSISILQKPDILLLDEVFSVGDESFIKKAKLEMEKKFFSVPIAILVSHQEEMIRRLCNRCILLKYGKIIADDTPQEVLKFYNSNV